MLRLAGDGLGLLGANAAGRGCLIGRVVDRIGEMGELDAWLDRWCRVQSDEAFEVVVDA